MNLHDGTASPYPGKVAEILDRRPGVRRVTLSHGDQVSTPRGTGLHGYRWLPLGERAALSITQYHGRWRLLGGFVEITQKKVRKRL